MFYNFLLTAYRTFLRNKTYSLLGILGLTLSVSCVIAIYTIINFQSGFDKHQENYDHVYRVISHFEKGEEDFRTATVQHPMSKALRGQVSGIEAISNTYLWSAQVSISKNDGTFKKLQQKHVGFVEPEITDILSINWIAGTPDIENKVAVMISKTTAKRYFDITDNFVSVVGKEIILGNEHRLIISGIYEDFPKNTDFPFEIMTAYDNQEGINNYFNKGKNWAGLNGGTECLIKANSDANIADLKNAIGKVYNQHNLIDGFSVDLQPMSTVHTMPYGNYSGITFDAKYNLISIVMMFFLALIGSINFINLSTARAITRAKEVGIRKIMGGKRSYLILQFLTESLLIVIVAFIIGFFLADQILLGFNELINSNLSLADVAFLDWTIFTSGSIFLVTLLSGLYPSLVLSGFTPLSALKIKASNIDRQSVIPTRKILVGMQFTFSIILVFGASVMFYQINYMKNEDPGFITDGIINVVFADADFEKQKAFKTDLLSSGKVKEVSFCLSSPMSGSNNTGKYYSTESDSESEVEVNVKAIDENYIQLFGIDLISGRNLSVNDQENRNIIVNKYLVKEFKLGTPQEAIGKSIRNNIAENTKYKIVGVVSDFHASSMKNELVPVFFKYDEDMFYQAAIKVNVQTKAGMKETVAAIEKSWEAVFPENLIEYFYLDQMMTNFYKFEEIMATSISFFVIIAIIVCAMGLYGLTDYIANAKRKELGVRKVVGANLSQLLMTFVKEVMPTLFLALIISGSMSYLLMNEWLEQFTYRISIGWQIISLTILIVGMIVTISMGYRSLLAARINPVDVLKDE